MCCCQPVASVECLWRTGTLLALLDLNFTVALAKSSSALLHHACAVDSVSSVRLEVGLHRYQYYQCADNWSKAMLASHYELCISLFQLFALNIPEGPKV